MCTIHKSGTRSPETNKWVTQTGSASAFRSSWVSHNHYLTNPLGSALPFMYQPVLQILPASPYTSFKILTPCVFPESTNSTKYNLDCKKTNTVHQRTACAPEFLPPPEDKLCYLIVVYSLHHACCGHLAQCSQRAWWETQTE